MKRLRAWFHQLSLSPRAELFVTMAIIALCVAGPTIGMLIYMNRSLAGERQILLAGQSRERRAVLEQARASVIRAVDQRIAALRSDTVIATLPPGRVFGHVMLREWADGCLVLDKNDAIAFPIPARPVGEKAESKADIEASEQLTELRYAAALRGGVPDADAWFALATKLAVPRLRDARTSSGRLVLQSVQFAALEAMRAGDPRRAALVSSLRSAIHDTASALPSSQRVYLWRKLAAFGDTGQLPWADAEEFSASAALGWEDSAQADNLVSLAGHPGVLQYRLEQPDIVLLFQAEKLRADFQQRAADELKKADFKVEFGPISDDDPLARLAVGKRMPGWEFRAVGVENLDAINSMLARRRFWLLFITLGSAVAATSLAAVVIRRFVLGARMTQLRQDFLSTVSHELRTPLTSIRMFVDMLSRPDFDDPARSKSYLNIIRRENERLSRFVENFLTFSRLKNGKVEFEFEPIAPSEIAEAAQSAVALRFSDSDCAFTVRCDEALPVVYVDQAAMTTSVVNLLENAFKYTGEKKRIALEVTHAADTVDFRVSDNGPGIAPEDLRRLGERFFRTADAGIQPGFGLGLSIVRAIVAAHGGRVSFDSTVGVGSTFTIHLSTKPTEP